MIISHEAGPRRLVIAVLAAVAFVAAVVSGAPAHAARTGKPDVQRMIVQEAARSVVPASLALGVAKVESNFNPSARSPVGARGVMQIMPKTARDVFGVTDPEDLWDARTNIRLGITYLEQLYYQYGQRWDLALSHYNGGTLKKKRGRYVGHGYTQDYVDAVLAWQDRFERDSTMIALADSVGMVTATRVADRGQSAPAGEYVPGRKVRLVEPEYWMFDRPVSEKGWRYYLKVADRWMASSRPRGGTAGTAPETDATAAAPAAAVGEDDDPRIEPVGGEEHGGLRAPVGAGEWLPAASTSDSPSHRLRAGVRSLRDRFRDRLDSGERPWRGEHGDGRKFI